MQKKRRSEISALNTLFCLLVIFIHIVSFPIGSYSPGTELYNPLSYSLYMIPWRLASFVVQGFVLLAGVKVFLTGKDSVPYPRYLKGRLLGVIIPYIVSFVGYYIYYYCVYDYPLDASFIVNHLVLGSLVCHYYFIPLLFQFDVLLPLWKLIVNKTSAAITIPVAVLASALFESYMPSLLSILFPSYSFVYNDRIITTYLAFWLIGCYIGRNYDSFREMLKNSFLSVALLHVAVTAANGYFSYLAYNGLAFVPFMNILHYFYTLTAILFLYALFLKLPEGFFERIPLASKIDRASYDIYLWHMLAVFGANHLLEYLGIYGPNAAFMWRMLLVYVVTVSVCVGYNELKTFIKRKTKSRQKA